MSLRHVEMYHARIRACAIVLAAIAAASCGGASSRDASDRVASPAGPSATAIRVEPGASNPAGQREGASAGLHLPDEGAAGAINGVAFPPRNESFDFRRFLDDLYRTELRRPLGSSFVDIEGDVVWTQEYLRYRVNRCDHLDSVQKVFNQIDGRGIAPVCGDAPIGTVAFPPRNESFDFRQQLEVKYRDGLRRSPSPTYVDIEGSIVWTQEYLRYRINRCDHQTATSNVLQQIRGGGIAPVCDSGPVAGTWNGTIFMPGGRTFRMDISQVGTKVTGTYTDIVGGFVSATYAGGVTFNFNVNFGDGQADFEGVFDAANKVKGSMRYNKSSNAFQFEMTRVAAP